MARIKLTTRNLTAKPPRKIYAMKRNNHFKSNPHH